MKRTSLPLLRRRELVGALGAAAAWPVAARAQQPERMRRIGVLQPAAADDPVFQARLAAFYQELALCGKAARTVLCGGRSAMSVPCTLRTA